MKKLCQVYLSHMPQKNRNNWKTHAMHKSARSPFSWHFVVEIAIIWRDLHFIFCFVNHSHLRSQLLRNRIKPLECCNVETETKMFIISDGFGSLRQDGEIEIQCCTWKIHLYDSPPIIFCFAEYFLRNKYAWSIFIPPETWMMNQENSLIGKNRLIDRCQKLFPMELLSRLNHFAS